MLRAFLTGIILLVGATAAEAEVKTKSIAYKHEDAELEGFLAWDDSIQGPRPGVLVVHEWWGLNDYAKKRAVQLAELGYVAFALDMYGKGKITVDPKEASQWAGHMRGDLKLWKTRALAGLEVLRSSGLCAEKKTAAIGYCFGGSTVLNLALEGVDLAAVVSFHGALPAATAEQARGTKAKILICHGAEDGFIPAAAIQKFRAALDEAKTDYIFVAYSGAVHSFTNPDADGYGVKGVAYQRAADLRSWQHMRDLFQEVFGSKK